MFVYLLRVIYNEKYRIKKTKYNTAIKSGVIFKKEQVNFAYIQI